MSTPFALKKASVWSCGNFECNRVREKKNCFAQILICALETEINCCTIGLLLEHCTLSHKATVREIIPEFLNFELISLF